MNVADLADIYVGLDEAAAILTIAPCSLRTILRHTRHGYGGHVRYTGEIRLIGGKYLVRRDELIAFKQTYDPRPGRPATSRRLI